MEAPAKTQEEERKERAIAWAKKMLASKRELETEIKDDVKTPEYQEALRKLRERNATTGTRVQRAEV